jgi:aryl-alcohol dehydrogenase-like predicted oxidoreductase
MPTTQLDHYRLLGRSGLRVSPLCLGTMTFGEDWQTGANEEDSKTIFDDYVSKGGNFIDTADLYTNGTSEQYVGKFANDVGRDRLVIATKFTFNGGAMGKEELKLRGKPDPNAGGNGRKHMRQAVEDSLRRLQTDYIDLLWVHCWDGRTPIEETMRGLDDLVAAGKVNHVGVSDYPAWKVAEANTLATLRGWSPFVALQVEYSLVERTTERDLIPMARDLGLGVTPWSPLGQGVLTGKFLDGGKDEGSRLEKNPNRLGGKYVSDRAEQAARAVVEIAKQKDVSPSRIALAWLLHQPGVTSPIIGARKTSHLDDNIEAVSVDLSADELQKLDEATRLEPGFPHDFLAEVDSMVTGGATVDAPHGRLV